MTSQDLPESKEVSQWRKEESRLVRVERDFMKPCWLSESRLFDKR